MTDASTSTTPRTGSRQPSRAPELDWPDFEARLAETLSRLPADQYLIVSAAATRDRYGYFVQFAQCGPAGFHAEAVSNDYLPGRAQLAPALERAMVEIGWQSPHPHAKRPQNYDRQWPQDTPFEEVAALAVRTLREIYRVASPAELRYRRFTRDSAEPIRERGLGIAPERTRGGHAHRPAPAADGTTAGAPVTASDLWSAVGRGLVETDVTSAVDQIGPGSWRALVSGLELFVRVLPDEPAAVRVFTPVLKQPSSPELLVALNDLNGQFSFARALHVNGEVMVAMEIAAPHVSTVVLGAACEALAGMAAHATTSLAKWLVPVRPDPGTGALLN